MPSTKAKALPIRHDNGAQYFSRTFQKKIRWLEIDSSPSFIRSPQGNGCAERFIPHPLWPETHSCLEDLQQALQRFEDEYNEKWLIERHRYRSPGQFPRDEDETRTTA